MVDTTNGKLFCIFWILLETAVASMRASPEGCSYALLETSGTVLVPLHATQPRKEVICLWKLKSVPYHKVTFKIVGIFGKAKCDCSCGNISLENGKGEPVRIFCQNDLPSIFQTVREISTIRLKMTSSDSLKRGPLFAYNVLAKKSFVREYLHYIRLKRDSDNQKARAENDKAEGKRTTEDVQKSSKPDNDSVATSGEKSRFARLPVILPAVLTVLIFIACLVFIALKIYNADEFPYDRSLVDLREEEATTCFPKRSRKKHTRNELYDVMLKEYKDETHRKNPRRKSSTIKIEGVAGNDPQTIAKKHLLLKTIRDPSAGTGAVGTLIKLSSSAFIASSMVRDNDKEAPIEPSIEEESEPLLDNEENIAYEEEANAKKGINGMVPEVHSSTPQGSEGKTDLPRVELDAVQPGRVESSEKILDDETGSASGLLSSATLQSPIKKEPRNSGSNWLKYQRLEKQQLLTGDSDEEMDYDCAQHIHRILSASKENIDEARRILPDDVKNIILPQDLETALAEFDFWPDSMV